jgi:uncharacterized protein (DUF433 family)
MTLEEAVWQDPDRLSGAVCFRGTRVPIRSLFDHLAHNELEQFKEGFPNISDEMIEAVINFSAKLFDDRFKQKRSA